MPSRGGSGSAQAKLHARERSRREQADGVSKTPSSPKKSKFRRARAATEADASSSVQQLEQTETSEVPVPTVEPPKATPRTSKKKSKRRSKTVTEEDVPSSPLQPEQPEEPSSKMSVMTDEEEPEETPPRRPKKAKIWSASKTYVVPSFTQHQSPQWSVQSDAHQTSGTSERTSQNSSFLNDVGSPSARPSADVDEGREGQGTSHPRMLVPPPSFSFQDVERLTLRVHATSPDVLDRFLRPFRFNYSLLTPQQRASGAGISITQICASKMVIADPTVATSIASTVSSGASWEEFEKVVKGFALRHDHFAPLMIKPTVDKIIALFTSRSGDSNCQRLTALQRAIEELPAAFREGPLLSVLPVLVVDEVTQTRVRDRLTESNPAAASATTSLGYTRDEIWDATSRVAASVDAERRSSAKRNHDGDFRTGKKGKNKKKHFTGERSDATPQDEAQGKDKGFKGKAFVKSKGFGQGKFQKFKSGKDQRKTQNTQNFADKGENGVPATKPPQSGVPPQP